MHRIKSALILCLSLSSHAFSAESFGTFKAPAASPQDLSSIMASYQNDRDVLTTIQGTVGQVCEEKGCWMTLDDKGASVRVVFKGYSFFVPAKLKGLRVVAEGVLRRKTQSVAEQQHYLKDAGASATDVQAVKKPLNIFEFEASGVRTL